MWPMGRLGHDRRWGPLLSAWRDGETEPAETGRLRAHLNGCPRCATRLAAFETLDGRVRRLVESRPAPEPRRIFAAVRGRHAPLAAPRRLALASAAMLVIAGGAISPQGQTVEQGVGQAAQRIFAGPSQSYAGDNAVLRAHAGDAVVYQQRRYSIMAAAADGSSLTPLGQTLVGHGPVYSLAGGKVLYDAGADGQHRWMVVAANGANAQPLPNAGDRAVMDVTPSGSEILLRATAADGTPSSAAGGTEVLRADGSIAWSDATVRDATGVNAYSLSPDGRYVLSGDTSFVTEYPVDGGARIQVPVTGVDVQRVQSAAGGTVAFTAKTLVGPDASQTKLYVYDNATGGGTPAGVPKVDSYANDRQPIFALSPDGSLLAVWGVRQQSSGLTLWGVGGSMRGQSLQESRLAGISVTSLQWSPDGHSLLVLGAYQGQNAAFVLGPATGLDSAALLRLGAGTDVAAAAWRSDGSGVLLLSDGAMPSGLIAVPCDGSPMPLLDATDPSLRPVYGGDNHAALLRSGGPPELLAVQGARPAAVPADASSFSWASDGQRAAVVAGGKLYLYDSRTGVAQRPIADGTAVSWSPQGARLLVAHADGSAVVIDTAGRLLASVPAALRAATLAWSPSGALVAGVQHDAAGDSVVTWSPSTGAVTDVATALDVGRIAWSPDGRSLAYGAADNGVTRLFVAPLHSGQPRAVAALAAPDDDFAWQSDGRALLVIQHDAPGLPGRLLAASVTATGARFTGLPSVTHIFAGPR